MAEKAPEKINELEDEELEDEEDDDLEDPDTEYKLDINNMEEEEA